MATSFHFPKLTSLRDVDRSSTDYDDHLVTVDAVFLCSHGAHIREDLELNVLVFSLAAWKELHGPVVERKLTVLRPIPPDHDWAADFEPCSLECMSVLLSKDKNCAVFHASLPMSNPDEALVAAAERLQQPVAIQTERFGELLLDSQFSWFEGEAEWNGKQISITFAANEEESIGDGLETAESLWGDERLWKQRIDAFALQELLPLKNDGWLDDGESPVTAEDFLARMSLTSISIGLDGKFEFWHDDGDVFYGHSIQISGNIKEGPQFADIPG